MRFLQPDFVGDGFLLASPKAWTYPEGHGSDPDPEFDPGSTHEALARVEAEDRAFRPARSIPPECRADFDEMHRQLRS